jgi:hypothetical protein
MAMSPRLLRPILSGDPDALRYIAAVQQADQQSLEPAVRKAITDFVVGCKTDGIWDAIKASCILMGARTLSGALVPLKGSAPTNNGPFVSGDYDRETGLLGNGSTKHLNSNRANNADPQDSHHVSVYVSAAIILTTDRNFFGTDGAAVAGGTNMFRLSTAPGTALGGTNRGTGSGSAFTVSGEGVTTGFKGLARAASTGFTVRSSGSNTSVTATSNTPTSRTMFFFARNDATNPPLFVSDPRIAFYSIGESLDLALLDSRVTALYNAIGAAI